MRTFFLAFVLFISGCTQQPMPAFSFSDLDNKTYTHQDFENNVTLVSFWATTCITCRKKTPFLIQLYKRYQDEGFDLVSVSMPYDRPDRVVQYVNKHQIPFTVTMDIQGDLIHRFGDIEFTPTLLLYDRNGSLNEKWVGEVSNEQLEAAIKALL